MANLIEKDLGAVSAYAYAVEQGYKGTEEQFAKEQAGFAQNAQQVATDKDTVVNVVNGFDQKVADANNAIGKTRTESVGAVTAEGTTQVDAVKQEGATQKKTVDDAINGIVADRAQIEQNKNDILSCVKKDNIVSLGIDLYKEHSEFINGYWVNGQGEISVSKNSQYVSINVVEESPITIGIIGRTTPESFGLNQIGSLVFMENDDILSFIDMSLYFVEKVTIDNQMSGYISTTTPKRCNKIAFTTKLNDLKDWSKGIKVYYGTTQEDWFKNDILSIKNVGVIPQPINPIENLLCDDYEQIPIDHFEKGFFRYDTENIIQKYFHKEIVVKHGEEYKVSCYSRNTIKAVVITDNNNKVIKSYPEEEDMNLTFHDFKFRIPNNASKMYLNFIYEGSGNPMYHIRAFKKIGKTLKWHKNEEKLEIIGDSLSEAFSVAPIRYCTLLEAHDNFITEIFARSGSGYMRDDENKYAFWKQAERITPNAKVCLVFGSFNDRAKFETMGTPSDKTTDTLCGCINATLDKIYEKNLNIKIGVITPTPWRTAYPTFEPCETYVNNIIQICKNRSIPCLDLFHQSGFKWDSEEFWIQHTNEGDGVHPNSQTHEEYIYPKVKEFVKKLLV